MSTRPGPGWWRLVVASAVSGILVAGCGGDATEVEVSGATSTGASLPSICDGSDSSPISADRVLSPQPTWGFVEVTGIEVASDVSVERSSGSPARFREDEWVAVALSDFEVIHPSTQILVTTSGSTPLREVPDRAFAEAVDVVAMRADLVDVALASIEAGDSLLMGILGDEVYVRSDERPGLRPVNVLVALAASGSARFLGTCTDGLTDTYAGFAASEAATAQGWTARDIVLGMVTGDEKITAEFRRYREAQRPPDPLSWEELSPGERMLDPGFAPGEVLAGLDLVTFRVVVPGEWLGTDRSLCSRNDVGHNYCYWLMHERNPISMQAYQEPGAGMEVHVRANSEFDAEVFASVELTGEEVARLASSAEELWMTNNAGLAVEFTGTLGEDPTAEIVDLASDG